MKLSNLFLIAALVGVVAVIGCSDDPATGNGGNGGSGTAGTGGSGTAGTGGSAGGDGGTGGAPDCTDGELCCLEACLINQVLYSNCLREYDNCIDMELGTPAQCEVAAEETCTL